MNQAPALWSSLIGQDEAVAVLAAAVEDAGAITRGEPGPAMSHAWLITGPPGSGRSLAATTFAAALVCAESGCGQCQACRTAEHGGHPDVHVEIPEGSELLIQHVSPLITMAAQAPISGMWRVIVIEDADRLNDHAANHLLKSLEEPTPHTVWVLCAPSVEDVLPTIASRVRHVGLRTPRAEDITRMLVGRAWSGRNDRRVLLHALPKGISVGLGRWQLTKQHASAGSSICGHRWAFVTCPRACSLPGRFSKRRAPWPKLELIDSMKPRRRH